MEQILKIGRQQLICYLPIEGKVRYKNQIKPDYFTITR